MGYFDVFIYLISLQPAKRHAYSQGGNSVFAPVERELVFDIVSHSFDFLVAEKY